MARTACRDCGALLGDDAEGCTTCARNLVAERKVARALVWAALVAAAFVIAAVALW